MSVSLRPPLDAAGIWTLKSPFAELLQAGVSYRCTAIRKVTDIVAKGEAEPWSVYYQPYGIDETVYKEDLAADVCIVTLQTSNNTTLYVPTTYITAFPDSSGMTYQSMLLGIDLGPIPVAMSLDAIKLMMTDLIRDTIGIEATVQEAVIGSSTQVSADSYASFEANRAAKIQNSTTFRARAIAAEAALADANTKINQLKDYIKNHP